jgi:hypothetical protein
MQTRAAVRHQSELGVINEPRTIVKRKQRRTFSSSFQTSSSINIATGAGAEDEDEEEAGAEAEKVDAEAPCLRPMLLRLLLFSMRMPLATTADLLSSTDRQMHA